MKERFVKYGQGLWGIIVQHQLSTKESKVNTKTGFALRKILIAKNAIQNKQHNYIITNFFLRRDARAVEWGGLENRYTSFVSGVRIPLSPPEY